MFKRIFSNKSIVITWLLSYIVIMAIALFSSTTSFKMSYDAITQQNNAFNEYVLSSISKNIKEILVSMRKLYTDISSNTNMAVLLSIKNKDDYYYNEKIFDLIKQNAQYGKFKNNLDFYYIYIFDTDMILSENGLIDSEAFYLSYFADEIPYETWKNKIKSVENNRYYSTRINGEDGTYDVISYDLVLTCKGVSADASKAVLSLATKKERFFEGVEKIEWTYLSDLFVYDKDGELILLRTASEEPYTPKNLRELKNIGADKMTLRNSISFDSVEMDVVMVSPKRLIIGDIEYVRKVFYITFVLCVMIIGITMVFFIKRDYKPIKGMLDMFGIKENYDEYALIKKYAENTIVQNRNLQTVAEKQSNALRLNEITNLLKGRYIRSYLDESLNRYDITFKCGNFAAAVFYIEDINNFCAGEEMPENEKFFEIRFIISNIMEELLNESSTSAYVTDVDGIIACLINFDDKEFVTSRLDLGTDFISENFNFALSYTLSGLHKTTSGISDAFNEALRALEYKTLFEIQGNFLFENIKDENDFGEYFFSPGAEQDLISYIKVGDYKNAENLVSEIFDNISSAKSISPEYVKSLMFDIAATLFKVPDFIGLEHKKLNEYFDYNAMILESDNINSMRTYILNAVKKICDYMSELALASKKT